MRSVTVRGVGGALAAAPGDLTRLFAYNEAGFHAGALPGMGAIAERLIFGEPATTPGFLFAFLRIQHVRFLLRYGRFE